MKICIEPQVVQDRPILNQTADSEKNRLLNAYKAAVFNCMQEVRREEENNPHYRALNARAAHLDKEINMYERGTLETGDTADPINHKRALLAQVMDAQQKIIRSNHSLNTSRITADDALAAYITHRHYHK